MELLVRFTKRPDGNVILRCTRPDDSVTWERYDKQAGFFVHHDLIHFAVETVLGLRQGFYGLLASGWNITDTTGKGDRGPIPAASVIAEHAVGLFTLERAGSSPKFTAEVFNEQMEQLIGRPLDSKFNDRQLETVRDRISDLHRQWAGVPAGSSLDLTFSLEN
jgi:hypothetical protein